MVLDHFNAIRLANAAVDDVRRRMQQETLGHRGRKGDPLYGIRRLLLWIDDDGRTRRYRYHPVTSEPTEEIFVWEFFDFGVEVDLSPPPPDKVK